MILIRACLIACVLRRWQSSAVRFVVIIGVLAGANLCAADDLTTTDSNAKLDIREVRMLSMLTPDLTSQIMHMRLRYALDEYGCIVAEKDSGPWSDPGFFPQLSLDRHRVYTGAGEAGTYNHHAQLTKFRGRFYLAWSNSRLHEAFPGQRTMISDSQDAESWSAAREVAPGSVETGLLRRTLGIYSDEQQMVLYTAATLATVEPDEAGSRRFVSFRLDTHATTDGDHWDTHEAIFEENVFFMEGPRPTQEGHLLAGAVRNGKPIAMIWPVDEPDGSPRVVVLPPTTTRFTPDGETSWYQLPDGRILLWFRDNGHGLRLFVATSEDGGESWSEPMLTDFPDSTSRVWTGRLSDGRYCLIGNSYPKLLDRHHLMLSVSDNGVKFDRMYSLLDDPVAQRAFGLLKLDGYQYPMALEDGNRLLIAYSINKEDIEVASLKLDAFE